MSSLFFTLLVGSARAESGCCFQIGFGSWMRPCCFDTQPMEQAICLEKMEPRLGGAFGWSSVCPDDADHAHKMIKADRLIQNEMGCCFNYGFGSRLIPCCLNHVMKPRGACLAKTRSPRLGGAVGWSSTCPKDAHDAHKILETERRNREVGCCFSYEFDPEAMPCCLTYVQKQREACLTDVESRRSDGAFGWSSACPRDANHAHEMIQPERPNPAEAGCCFNYAFGERMVPCCLNTAAKPREACLTDMGRPRPGGAFGWNSTCPRDAGHAHEAVVAERRNQEVGCCFSFQFNEKKLPCCLDLVQKPHGDCLKDDNIQDTGRRTGWAKTCPSGVDEAYSLTGGPEVTRPDVGCCFNIGFARMMRPCCLNVQEKPRVHCLTEVSGPRLGGAVGWSSTCPLNATHAHAIIKSAGRREEFGCCFHFRYLRATMEPCCLETRLDCRKENLSLPRRSSRRTSGWSPTCPTSARDADLLVNSRNPPAVSSGTDAPNSDNAAPTTGISTVVARITISVPALDGVGRCTHFSWPADAPPLCRSNTQCKEMEQCEVDTCIPSICKCNPSTTGNGLDCSSICVHICKPKVCSCTRRRRPVCGKDNVTYVNQCEADCKNQPVLHRGACGRPESKHCICMMIHKPVCGKDNVTYSNECIAACKGHSVLHKGACPRLDGTCDRLTGCGNGLHCLLPTDSGIPNPTGTCVKPRRDLCVNFTWPPKGAFFCSRDSHCSQGQYCDKKNCMSSICRCNQETGMTIRCSRDCNYVCAARPACRCRAVHRPVCGIDGTTYPNKCTAACAGVIVLHYFACCRDTAKVNENCGGFLSRHCERGLECLAGDTASSGTCIYVPKRLVGQSCGDKIGECERGLACRCNAECMDPRVENATSVCVPKIKRNKCGKTGYFRDPVDCNRFYRCLSPRVALATGFSRRINYKCPDSLMFDTRMNACLPADDARPPCVSSMVQSGGDLN
eukprot:GEMP01004016.1.p1 GENE.GEMP01004016.1~~GEMP01004016.1.p1  ORF type:complete len:959 (+),score=92.99 GEMP01004016.1:23-2899(+)